MGYEPALIGQHIRDFGYGEHLLIWSWRRLAKGGCCPLLMEEFTSACGEEGPEVFVTFCTFLQALGIASRKRFTIGAPGCPAITRDERQVLALLASAQAQTPALLEAHLRWLAIPEKRHVLQIATGALARALCENGLGLTLPTHPTPDSCERPQAVA